jgi:RNA polymerase sigma-70 factor (ECF subfamily)
MAIITHLCRAYARDNEDLADLIQEISYQLWKSRESFQGRARLSTWVYRVTLNVCLAHSRKGKRHPDMVPLMDHDQVDEQDQLQQERIRALYQAIRKLNESDRAVALLYLEDKSYKEMSDILGITVSNVGVKVNRLKEKLKNIMNG